MTGITRRGALKLGGAAVATPALLSLGACSPSEGSSGAKTLKILQYEDPTTPQGIGWKRAVELFTEKHPDVTVDLQQTSFDAVRQSAKITLSGNDVPDVAQINNARADMGEFVKAGQLLNLEPYAEAYGWADLVLTEPVRTQLRELAARARHREKVLAEWRMRPGGGRGHAGPADRQAGSGAGLQRADRGQDQ